MQLSYLLKEAKYYYKLHGLSRLMKKFLLTQTPLRKLVNSKYYGRVYMNRIRKKAGMNPRYLQIETTNICNARCKMCPHIKMKRNKRVMTNQEYAKILDNVMKHYKIERLTINGFGEPFVDRGIIEKIKYTNSRYPKLKIDLYTNAALLTPELTEQVLKTKISRITFSINGDESSYNEVMGLDYTITRRNTLHFLRRKKETSSKILTNVSMMLIKSNLEKSNKFINFWKKYADSVRVYYPSDWAGALKENLGEQKIPYGRKQWPCMGVFGHIVIHASGEFIVCCRDFDSQVKFGNLLDGDDIKQLRESEEFRKLQQQHLNLDFSSPICRNCDHALDSSIDWWL